MIVNKVKMMLDIKIYVNELYSLDIMRNTRKRQYVEARAFYYKLCKDITKSSLTEIGDSVNRNHTSVLHSLRNVIHFLDKEEIVKGNLHFGNVINLNKSAYEYLKYKNGDLTKKLKKANKIIDLIPSIKNVFDRLEDLSPEQKENIKGRTDWQFSMVSRCLDRVQEIINVQTEKEYETK